MRTKAMVSFILALVVLFAFPASALANGENSWNYTWNENIPQKNSPTGIVVPMSGLTVFHHYTPTSQVVNYKRKYVGEVRVDNSGNPYTATTMSFVASASGTFTATASVSETVKVELDAIVAKVEATVSIGGSISRSWTRGTTYGSSTPVPAGKIGTTKAYIPGTSSLGTAYYRIYNTTDDTYTTFTKPVGAIVPAKNMWNFVVNVS